MIDVTGKKKIPYPYNFLIDAQLIEEQEIRGLNENPDLDFSFLYLLKKIVPDKNREIFRLYYEQGMSVIQIHNRLGVSRQWVYNVIDNTIKKVTEVDECKTLLKWGIDEYIDTLIRNAVKESNEKSYRKGFNEGKKAGYDIGRWMNNKPKGETEEVDLINLSPEHTPIELLSISLRTKNILLRNGVVSVADLMNCSPQEIAAARGCGKAIFKEIIDVRAKLGCDNKEFEQILKLL